MYIECLSNLDETKLNTWKIFLKDSGLLPDLSIDKTVLIWDNDELIGTGSRKG